MDGRWPTRWLVVVGRRLKTPAGFLWARLTPGGGFGLEVTTLLAALAVALFVLISYAVQIHGDPGPTAADRTAFDVADALQARWLTDLAKVITDLGSAAVVLPLALLAAGGLASARRWSELAVLVVGTLIIFFGVHDIKDAVDRPRPAGALVKTSGASFPSAHTAYSVFYLWAALTLVVRLRPGMGRATAVVVVGIAITVLVGLSRVYLRAHFLSDVSAGWALGISAYALCAVIALVAAQLRQNGQLGAAGKDRN
jgi:undecaprenyl-diphosphatase